MPAAASISQKQFAARVGLSRQYVGRLIAAGKLPVLEDKCIPMPDGLAALHALRGDAPGDTAAHDAPAPARTPSAPRTIDPADATSHAAAAKLNLDLRRVQLSERANRAKLLDLEWRIKSGAVVNVDEVAADARACAETLREQLLALAPRVASQIEALAARPAGPPRAAAIEDLISQEVNRLIASVHSRFME